MMWIVIVLSILAAAGVTYGVIRGKKGEKLGLTQIKKWKKSWVPLTLIVDEEKFLPEEVARVLDAAREAARFWNKQTGVALFVDSEEVGTGAVVPVMRHDPLTMEHRDDATAYASLTINKITGSLSRAVVYMKDWENLPIDLVAKVLRHELGHCLGLAHDENSFSVMHPSSDNRVYCVSSADKAFLREVYG